MASEDVIELGSSDDEPSAEPQAKKAKTVPDLMVHIPRKLPDLTIKPAKAKPTPVIKKLAEKPVTITKIKTTFQNPYATKNKISGRPELKKIMVPNKSFNPLVISKIRNPQLVINKIPANKNLKKFTNISGPLINLPPQVILNKKIGDSKNIVSGIKVVGVSKMQKKALFKKNATTTVELDDDECTPSSAPSPLWYLRPEEQRAELSIEQQNNKEPDASKSIEIIIEDSPIKPVTDNRAFEIGAELAITIDDSPIKPMLEKKVHLSGSDDERVTIEKEKNSKKKLVYPNNVEITGAKTIEIELEPILVDIQDKAIQNKDTCEQDKQEMELSKQDDVVVIQENSPMKTNVQNISEQKNTEKNESEPMEVVKDDDLEASEFHPVYQSFIDLCFQLENSEDMNKIVEKKIKAYYKQVPRDYTDSEAFIDMVSSKVMSMKAGPEKMYLYIKDIVDELNLQRKMFKSKDPVTNNAASKEEVNKFLYGEESEFDSKRQRQIRKLEKTLKKLHRAIQLLEEQEVDFDDDDDSVYLLTERYKERMVRVHAKFCQLTNTKMPSEPRVLLESRPGQPNGPAKKLEKWINRKVPIGTPLPFPDFHDVLRCVREANEEEKYGWNEADVMEEARDLFVRCGKKLQRRRQESEWRLAASRVNFSEDPAEKNDELKKELQLNQSLAAKREAEIFNKYVDRQNLLKLEAEEIGDKEADESPVESEEDDNNDDETSLQNKEKRKERLKRLLQEKSKKSSIQEKIATENNSKENEDEKSEQCKGDNEKENEQESTLENKENKVSNEVKSLENDNIKSVEEISDKIESLSDDSNKVDSDIDELHLLEKLHSENENRTSSVDSSDSDSPIEISDSYSSDESKASDVISIENSSYSESETVMAIDDEVTSEDKLLKDDVSKTITEVEMSIQKTNNNECSESVEDILLASSDDEVETKGNNKMEEQTVATLENELITEEKTVIEGKHTDFEEPKENVDLNNQVNSEKPAAEEVNIPPANIEEETLVVSSKDSNITVKANVKEIQPNISDVIDKTADETKSSVDTESIPSIVSNIEVNGACN